MRHEMWNEISANPSLAGLLLLVALIAVTLWAWWPAGFLLP
jgi:hypothetical protein